MGNKKGSKAGPASKKGAKPRYPLSRSDDIFKEVIETFQISQNYERDQLADVHLVCKDGIIPAHAIMLKAASKLFAEALESQGDNYTNVRLVLLPDYYIKDIRHVVQIIYSGIARFSDNEDAEIIEEMLKEFCLENFKTTKSKSKVNDEEEKLVRGYRTKRINRPTNGAEKSLCDLEPLFGGQTEAEKKKDTSIVNSSKKRRTRKGTDSSSNSSSGSDSEYKPRKRRRTKDKSSKKSTNGNMDPVVRMERTVLPVKTVVLNRATPTPTKSNTTTVAVRKVNSYYSYNGNQYENNEEENEPDSDAWEEPDYNNKAWFETEARKCQKCNKQHNNPAAASQCITGHQRLRCYFCFTIAKNTEKLFEHFTKKHKQAGRENCLMCPYCEQTVPFKSVSCHVISIHLSDNRGQIKAKAGPYIGPGRPPGGVVATTVSASVASSSSSTISVNSTPVPTPVSSPKRETEAMIVSSESGLASDDGFLRVGNLDVTIRNKMGNGKIMVYHLQKDRSTT